MASIRYFIIILLMVLTAACTNTRQDQSAKSLPDNEENRTLVAKRYLEVMPPKEMLQGVAGRVAPNLPEKNRQVFTEVMQSQAIEKAAYRLSLEGLVKYFTVGELQAMVAFYGSAAGKSAAQKFSSYTEATMPQIQQEVKKAVEETQKQRKPKEQQNPQAQPEPAGPKEKKAPQSKK